MAQEQSFTGGPPWSRDRDANFSDTPPAAITVCALATAVDRCV